MNGSRLAALFCVAILPLLATASAFAAEEAKPTFECRWAGGPIKIDGKADEPPGSTPSRSTSSTLPWLKEKARPAKTATKATLLWDREYLYFFAEMDDADLFADVKEHDGMTWDNDVFELFFKPADDKPGYYEFQVNAAGTVIDMFLPRRGAGGFARFIKDGEFHIEVGGQAARHAQQVERQGQGLVGRGAHPVDATSSAPAAGRSSARRGSSPSAATTTRSTSKGRSCRPAPRCQPTPTFHQLEDYATLKFVGPDSNPRKPLGIEKRVPLTHVARSSARPIRRCRIAPCGRFRSSS